VSSAGDINGDGFADVIIGATGSGPGSPGAYVVFGKVSGFARSLELATLDGTEGFKLRGLDNGFYGISVGAGDVNGDGFADVIVGATGTDNDTGAAYVIFGKASGFVETFDVRSLMGTDGFKISGVEFGDYAGLSVSGAGDVNGDGFSDLVVGARLKYSNPDPFAGAAYVIFGGDPARLQIAADGLSATFGDVDGDLVTVKTTVGKFTEAMFELRAEGVGFQLERLDVADPAFAGAKLSFFATPHKIFGSDGNSRVNVGFLDATGVDLFKVRIPGDLGRIGAGNLTDPNLRSMHSSSAHWARLVFRLKAWAAN
jgi:hypothetical protein